jgi:hypothetical protein
MRVTFCRMWLELMMLMLVTSCVLFRSASRAEGSAEAALWD